MYMSHVDSKDIDVVDQLPVDLSNDRVGTNKHRRF